MSRWSAAFLGFLATAVLLAAASANAKTGGGPLPPLVVSWSFLPGGRLGPAEAAALRRAFDLRDWPAPPQGGGASREHP